MHLTGTKLGCGEGGCGACTVMLSQYNPHTNKIRSVTYILYTICHNCKLFSFNRHISANACLLPICSVDGLAVTTVEGIGSTLTKLHPCQVLQIKSYDNLSVVLLLLVITIIYLHLPHVVSLTYYE